MPADFNDRTDFENSDRGFIASLDPLIVKMAGFTETPGPNFAVVTP